MKNRNKEIYQTIPEGCNRESSPSKKSLEIPAPCRRQLRGWVATETPDTLWVSRQGILPLIKEKAFTLIELLVVVLIIGILTAIAISQYELAVEKARATEALIMVRKIAEANQRYFLANGTYTDDITLLDLDIPGEDYQYSNMNRKKNDYFDFGTYTTRSPSVIAVSNRLPMIDRNSYFFIVYSDNKIMCLSNTGAARAERICKAICGGTTCKW